MQGMFITLIVVSAQNAFLGCVVEADTIVSFKRHLDRHMDIQKIKGIGESAGRLPWFNLVSWPVLNS